MDITWLLWTIVLIGAVVVLYLLFKHVLPRTPGSPQNVNPAKVTLATKSVSAVKIVLVASIVCLVFFLIGNYYGYVAATEKVERPDEGVVYTVIRPSYAWKTNTFAVLQVMEHDTARDVWLGRWQPEIYQVPHELTNTQSRVIGVKRQDGRVELLPHPLRPPERQLEETR